MHSPCAHSTNRILGYDVLRVVSIVAVVATHVLMVYRGTADPNVPVSLLDALLHFAVPTFYFVSGALVWGRYTGRTASDYGEFLKSRALTILAPYLVWSALYLSIAGARGDWTYWLARTPMLLLTGKSWYHLYFIPVLILFYLLTPLVAPIVRRRPELLLVVAYAIRIFLAAPVSSLADRVGGPLLVTFAVSATTHVSNMALGAWFAVRKDRVLPWLQRGWLVLLGVGGALLLANTASALPDALPSILDGVTVSVAMGLLVLGMVGFAFSLHASTDAAEKVARAGTLAFGVYFMHPALLLALRSTLDATGTAVLWDSTWFPMLSILAVTLASFAIASVLASLPATSWLVGIGRKRGMKAATRATAAESSETRRAA